jgi:hypothetical protein
MAASSAPIAVSAQYMQRGGWYIAIHEQQDAQGTWRVVWRCEHRNAEHLTCNDALACGRAAAR